METARLPRPPGHRHETILHDTQFFTEEPNSLPHSRAPTLHFGRTARPPLSRENTDHVGAHTYPPYNVPEQYGLRKWTQEDQNEYDEKMRKKVMSELVQSWMDRLQLISVITTFFAAIEAQLLGITTPSDPGSDTRVDQAANAALAGALVVHVFAAIVSFLAAFFLIRYKLAVAKREERKVEAHDGIDTISSSSVWSTNPHLEQVGPFRGRTPPTHLLDHCHSLCIWLSAIGFVLALVGIMCYVWASLAVSARAFASVCMGVCVVCTAGAIFWPASAVHVRSKAT